MDDRALRKVNVFLAPQKQWISAHMETDIENCCLHASPVSEDMQDNTEAIEQTFQIYSNTLFKLGESDPGLPSIEARYSFYLSTKTGQRNERDKKNNEQIMKVDFATDSPKALPFWKKEINKLVAAANERGHILTSDQVEDMEEKEEKVEGREREIEVAEEEVTFDDIGENTASNDLSYRSETNETLRYRMGEQPKDSNQEMKTAQDYAIALILQGRSNTMLSIAVSEKEMYALTVLELKARVYLKLLTADLPTTTAFHHLKRPEELCLSVNGAELQDHWKCAEFGLHPFSTLSVSMRVRDSRVQTRAGETMSHDCLFKLHVESESFSSELTLDICTGDVVEDVVKKFIVRHNLDSALFRALVLEVYKGVSKAFQKEVKELHSQMSTLQRAKQSGGGGQMNQSVEAEILSQQALLQEATKQIYSLEQDKRVLNSRVLELNKQLAGLSETV